MFGQTMPPQVHARAREAVLACDLLLAAGTTLTVEPAGSLCATAVRAGARRVIAAWDPTPYDRIATEVVRESLADSLPRIAAHVREGAAGGDGAPASSAGSGQRSATGHGGGRPRAASAEAVPAGTTVLGEFPVRLAESLVEAYEVRLTSHPRSAPRGLATMLVELSERRADLGDTGRALDATTRAQQTLRDVADAGELPARADAAARRARGDDSSRRRRAGLAGDPDARRASPS